MCAHVEREGERGGVSGTAQLVKFCHRLREEEGQLGECVQPEISEW